jgi:hypothetical protein
LQRGKEVKLKIIELKNFFLFLLLIQECYRVSQVSSTCVIQRKRRLFLLEKVDSNLNDWKMSNGISTCRVHGGSVEIDDKHIIRIISVAL